MKNIRLPEPHLDAEIGEVLYKRRSVRRFSKKPLSVEEVSDILWAAMGKSQFRRTYPSAGAKYPLELYLVIGDVEGIDTGFYYYNWIEHSLEFIDKEDLREKLCNASLNQRFISETPLDIVIAADFERTISFYGERGRRYVYIEAGHVGQNIYLACEALNLGTVAVGAFNDEEVKEVLNILLDPIYIMPVGHKDLNILIR
ncbi:MAG TPA: SagB/ThcOx family dehydrogenase [Methanomicrobia archaeon]|nr:SagB/ThcOx family dehydrogenase [Methanomicrobia archaeon]